MAAVDQSHQQQQQLAERLKQLDTLSTTADEQFDNSLNVPIDDFCRLLLAALAGDELATGEAKKLCPPSSPFANAIGSLAVGCLRDGIGPDELAMEIQQLNSASSSAGKGNEIRNAFLEAYRSNFGQLKLALAKSTGSFASGGSAYPKVVGMDWSILSVIESTEDAEFEEPLAEITFKTEAPPGPSAAGGAAQERQQNLAPGQFKFVCNKNQLQDFHWKVKEACNFIHKLASNEK
ncbi:hypothetical protein niasHS_006080 [Heterodera schachtii]|uniref:COMM domain-containing protein 3 n=1 Tax=Heterodera schachtii TaxID=97005 RepID=A0ABD2JVV3_HETSC